VADHASTRSASTLIATSPAEKRSTVQVCHVTNGGAPLCNTYNELRLRGIRGRRSSSQGPAGDSRGNAAVAARQNALDSGFTNAGCPLRPPMNRKTGSDLLVHTTEQNLAAVHQGDLAALGSFGQPRTASIRILCSFALASGNPGPAQVPPNLNAFRLGSSEPESTVAHNISQGF